MPRPEPTGAIPPRNVQSSAEAWDTPANTESQSTESADVTTRQIGRYMIKRAIGSGGMGTVYEAIQDHPRRTVALKMTKQGVASKSALRRFEFESQILARLRHPGIAQVYDAGMHDDGTGGVPYFVMEYIPNAKPLTIFARDQNLNTRQRLALFAQVCQAVHHGHQKGIIHRDLKPANILVDSSGQPKIIDFGVARAIDSDLAVTTMQTGVGQLIGTLQYMSPEQVEADPNDIDTRSDVYSLGVVLYELLTERVPYNLSETPVYEATRKVKEELPARMSIVNKTLRGDVETIVLKALEKDRTRRYQSSDELCRDIQNYLHGQPIAARPPSLSYQLQMLARRNKVAVTALAAVLAALLIGTIGTTVGMIHARQAEYAADLETQRAKTINSFLTKTMAAANPFLPNRSSRMAMYGAAGGVYAGEAGRNVTAVDLLLQSTEYLNHTVGMSPSNEADLRQTLGETFRGLGMLPESRAQLVRAINLRRTALGPNHPDVFRSMLILAETLGREGRGAESDQMFSEAQTGLSHALGPTNADTLNATSDRAGALLRRGDVEQALQMQRQNMGLARRSLGDNNMATLDQMMKFCGMLWEAGHADEAVEIGRLALQGLKRTAGNDAQSTADAMCMLSGPLAGAGLLEDAETMAADSVHVTGNNLGPGHPVTLAYRHKLAIIMYQRNRFDEAENLLREVLEREQQFLPTDDFELLTTKNDLAATILERGGNLVEAESLVREALEGYEKILTPDSPYTLNTADTLAMLLHKQSKLTQAIKQDEMVLQRAGQSDSLKRIRIYAHQHLAEFLIDAKRFDEAEQHLKAAVHLADPGESSKILAFWSITPSFVRLYEAWGRNDDAARWRAKSAGK